MQYVKQCFRIGAVEDITTEMIIGVETRYGIVSVTVANLSMMRTNDDVVFDHVVLTRMDEYSTAVTTRDDIAVYKTIAGVIVDVDAEGIGIGHKVAFFVIFAAYIGCSSFTL